MKKEKEERDKIKWCKYVLYKNYDFEVCAIRFEKIRAVRNKP